MIAWRAGFTPGIPNAFEPFAEALKPGHAVVGIFDGIETLFSRLRTSEREQAAVEALLGSFLIGFLSFQRRTWAVSYLSERTWPDTRWSTTSSSSLIGIRPLPSDGTGPRHRHWRYGLHNKLAAYR
jgi:hypothetical protein